jgi:hypothetical protein
LSPKKEIIVVDQQYEAHARTLKLSHLEPWPEPITDAPALFDELEAYYLRHLHLPPGAAIALTIWVPHAHTINAFTHSPRLNFTSATLCRLSLLKTRPTPLPDENQLCHDLHDTISASRPPM